MSSKKVSELDSLYIYNQGVRSKNAAEKMLLALRNNGVKSGTVKMYNLDLKSLQSVRQFAGQVLQDYSQIHLLINNGRFAF